MSSGDSRVWQQMRLLLLNSHADTIVLLRDWFGALGAVVHHARTTELCSDRDHARVLLDRLRPDIVLFDLAVPYQRTWNCFRQLSESGLFGTTPVVLTTVNRGALDTIVGPTEAFEVVGTPQDLQRLQDLIEWRLSGASREPQLTRH